MLFWNAKSLLSVGEQNAIKVCTLVVIVTAVVWLHRKSHCKNYYFFTPILFTEILFKNVGDCNFIVLYEGCCDIYNYTACIPTLDSIN